MKTNSTEKPGPAEGSLFTEAQIAEMHARYGEHSRLDPNSEVVLSLRELVAGLPESMHHQLIAANIPWLRLFARQELRKKGLAV